jgi:hypothetical protein
MSSRLVMSPGSIPGRSPIATDAAERLPRHLLTDQDRAAEFRVNAGSKLQRCDTYRSGGIIR